LNCTLASESRIGTRLTNQDRVGYWRTERSLLMVVADGLGGHQGGELAAQIATDHFGDAFQRGARPALADPKNFLSTTLNDAHGAILREAYRLGLPDGPRTVIVACLVQDGNAFWAHIGDCRLYLVRQGRIVVQTRDHTVVQQLVDSGSIPEEAACTHPERNRILQCLGGYLPPRPDPIAKTRLARRRARAVLRWPLGVDHAAPARAVPWRAAARGGARRPHRAGRAARRAAMR